MTILGFRDKKAQKLAEEAHELKTEVAGIVQQMREHVITYHQTLDKRVSAVESIVGDHNKVVTELRVAIAKDMVTRDEIREVERRLIDNVNTKFELLMQQLRKD